MTHGLFGACFGHFNILHHLNTLFWPLGKHTYILDMNIFNKKHKTEKHLSRQKPYLNKELCIFIVHITVQVIHDRTRYKIGRLNHNRSNSQTSMSIWRSPGRESSPERRPRMSNGFDVSGTPVRPDTYLLGGILCVKESLTSLHQPPAVSPHGRRGRRESAERDPRSTSR